MTDLSYLADLANANLQPDLDYIHAFLLQHNLPQNGDTNLLAVWYQSLQVNAVQQPLLARIAPLAGNQFSDDPQSRNTPNSRAGG